MQAGSLQLYYKSGSSTGVSPGSFQKFSRRPSLLAIFKQLLWKQKSTDLRSTEAGEYHPKMVRETEWFFHKAKAFWKYFLQNFRLKTLSTAIFTKHHQWLFSLFFNKFMTRRFTDSKNFGKLPKHMLAGVCI